jgi:hypothetical protein
MSDHPLSLIDQLRIFEVRGRAVVLDSGLAAIYGVRTGYLNRAMKRNSERFPANFTFRLTKQEWDSLRCQIGTLKYEGPGDCRF